MRASEALPRSVLTRKAVVYVRQSTPTQVKDNLESQRRQYQLVDVARQHGFAAVEVIDDDLGLSASGSVARPGFERLVAWLCAGEVGAVLCIEASRVSRNGRDWHHLIDLCALAGSLVIDPDGVYDPRLINDRLLLGLKGTFSEYELSLLRQRGLAARDAKAERGELRFTLPPGYCWGASGRIEIDPDERVAGAIRLVFEKFQELGSGRQVHLWFLDSGLSLPVVRRNLGARQIEWRPATYHAVHQILKNPIYAGAYVFGRRGTRPNRSTGPPPSGGARWNTNSRRPNTRHRWRHAATSWSILPSGMSRASWRRGGTRRWSALSKSSNALLGWTPSGRLIRGSIRWRCSPWRTIFPPCGMRRRRVRGRSSD